MRWRAAAPGELAALALGDAAAGGASSSSSRLCAAMSFTAAIAIERRASSVFSPIALATSACAFARACSRVMSATVTRGDGARDRANDRPPGWVRGYPQDLHSRKLTTAGDLVILAGVGSAQAAAVDRTLSLFDERPPTSEQAWRVVERIALCATFCQQRQKCAGACCKRKGALGHGPYWYAVWDDRVTGKSKRRYVGSAENKRRIELAHDVVRAELHAAEAVAAAAPEGRRLRELQQRAGVYRISTRRRAVTLAQTQEVPILGRAVK